VAERLGCGLGWAGLELELADLAVGQFGSWQLAVGSWQLAVGSWTYTGATDCSRVGLSTACLRKATAFL
jgi:hypothetical protein